MAVREAGALLALGALGWIWAVAVAQRRLRGPERSAMLDARTQLQVRLDALRARTAILARRDLPAQARELVDRVVEQEVLVAAVLSRAANVEDVADVDGEVEDAFITVEEAAAMVHLDMPAGDPFAGLCWVDPAHGEASTHPPGAAGATCAECAAVFAHGVTPERRQVTRAGRPVPFDEAAPGTSGPADGPVDADHGAAGPEVLR